MMARIDAGRLAMQSRY